MRKKFKALLFLLILAPCFLFAMTPNQERIKTLAPSGNKLSLLFLQHAKDITFTPTTKNCYRVLLSNIQDSILYFSDRPNRVVGHVSTEEFVTAWREQKIVPNTVVQGLTDKNNSKSVTYDVLSFSNPKFNKHSNTVSAEACITDPKKQKALSYSHLYNVSLFIDSFSLWPALL